MSRPRALPDPEAAVMSSSAKQGFYSRIKIGPRMFRHLMNCWPPFWGLRVHIMHISPDWAHIRMRMKLSLRNKNYVGTHFGGGLFAMTDPFYMLMLMNLLGNEYRVWDKAARIEFIAPGRSTVFADFRVTAEMLADIRANTASGAKYEPEYRVDIVDGAGTVIASVHKTLYIRRKSA
jgi:acyl-coenzyme A thioesterase PaaI-like protein